MASFNSQPKVKISELILLFLKMGATGFGGPVALVALMERECCHRLKWIGRTEFNEAYVICKLLPGPVAFQMSLWMGQHVGGRSGGLLAGIFFLLPGFFLVLLVSYYYGTLQGRTGMVPILEGMRVGALLVILDSLVCMSRPYAKQVSCWLYAGGAALAMLAFPRWEPLLILAGGLVSIALEGMKRGGLKCISPILFQIFWVHFKAGFFVFGTGLAILPVLEHEVVHVFQWLSPSEFMDGIAFGQVTPGPITITSVFIGYRAGSLPGALAAFVGMYLPGVILILGVIPLMQNKLLKGSWLQHFQRGAVPAVLGCILGATVLLGRMTVTDFRSVLVLFVLGGLALKSLVPAWTLIPLGSLLLTLWETLQ